LLSPNPLVKLYATIPARNTMDNQTDFEIFCKGNLIPAFHTKGLRYNCFDTFLRFYKLAGSCFYPDEQTVVCDLKPECENHVNSCKSYITELAKVHITFELQKENRYYVLIHRYTRSTGSRCSALAG